MRIAATGLALGAAVVGLVWAVAAVAWWALGKLGVRDRERP